MFLGCSGRRDAENARLKAEADAIRTQAEADRAKYELELSKAKAEVASTRATTTYSTKPSSDRAERRLYWEKRIIDLESRLPSAENLDRQNHAWNENKMKELADQREKFVKSDRTSVGGFIGDVIGGTMVQNEIRDSSNWKKPTNNAEKIRQEIAEAKKHILDIGS